MNIHKEGYSPGKIPQNGKHAWFSQPGGAIPLVEENGSCVWEECGGYVYMRVYG
jgi:hypothetical protein